jgi:hypothetical protein
VITTTEHRQALALPCPVCAAAPGERCPGMPKAIGHVARWHELASRGKPEPDAAAVEALTTTPGQRTDAVPFVHWLDGRHTFRLSRPGADRVMAVYCGDQPVTVVRRALVELAARHGLVVLAGTGGRGAFAVTPRGRAFAAGCLKSVDTACDAAETCAP